MRRLIDPPTSPWYVAGCVAAPAVILLCMLIVVSLLEPLP